MIRLIKEGFSGFKIEGSIKERIRCLEIIQLLGLSYIPNNDTIQQEINNQRYSESIFFFRNEEETAREVVRIYKELYDNK